MKVVNKAAQDPSSMDGAEISILLGVPRLLSAPSNKAVLHVDPAHAGLELLAPGTDRDVYMVPSKAGTYVITAVDVGSDGQPTITQTKVIVVGRTSPWAARWAKLIGLFGGVNWSCIIFSLILAGMAFGVGSCTGGGGCNIQWPTIGGCTPDTRPRPTPTKPQPTSPVPAGFQRVILMYESSSDNSTALEWADPDLQAYLDAKKVERRLVDQNADVTGPDWLKQAVAAFKAGGFPVPFLMVQDMKGNWDGTAWPKTGALALEYLKKRGG